MTGQRLFDIVVTALALVLLAPIMIVIALAIRLDSPGPCLFRQVRVGRDGRPFRILKFRTMRHDIEVMEAGLGDDEDPRIARLGRMLRKHKLNELPQLFNVLRGEMSIVGPRPELPRFVEQYKLRDRDAVLSVRPGITDPASLRYRNEGELLAAEADPYQAYVDRIMPRKLAIARWYLRRRSLLHDAAILFATAYALVSPHAVAQARPRILLGQRTHSPAHSSTAVRHRDREGPENRRGEARDSLDDGLEKAG